MVLSFSLFATILLLSKSSSFRFVARTNRIVSSCARNRRFVGSATHCWQQGKKNHRHYSYRCWQFATMTDSNNKPSREELRGLRLAMFGNKSRDNEKEETVPKRHKTNVPAAQVVVDLMASSSSDQEDDQKPKAASRSQPENKKAAPLEDNKEIIDLWESGDDEDDEKEEPKSKTKALHRTTNNTSDTKGKWLLLKESSHQQSQKGNEASFQVASYNLWFGPQRNGTPHIQARMQAVADLLLARTNPPLYFMAFQEVVHSLDNALFPLLESSNYKIIRQPLDNPFFLPYGVALAVHQGLQILDGGWKPYRFTQMDRGFVYARCRLPNGLVCLATSTHLESWAGKEQTGSTARQQQLGEMEKFCNDRIEQKAADICIMMGDLNWDDASRKPTDPVLDEMLSSVEWKDAWIETNHLRSTADAKKGYTYDGKLNPMLGGNLRRRFDRCLVRYARHVPTKLVSTVLVGTNELPGLTFDKENPYTGGSRTVPTAPSDHFGLVSEIQTFASSG